MIALMKLSRIIALLAIIYAATCIAQTPILAVTDVGAQTLGDDIPLKKEINATSLLGIEKYVIKFFGQWNFQNPQIDQGGLQHVTQQLGNDVLKYLPSKLQTSQKIKPINEKKIYGEINSRICVTNPVTGQVTSATSDETIKTYTPSWYSKLLNTATIVKSLYNPGSLSTPIDLDSAFETQHFDPANIPQCDEIDKGKQIAEDKRPQSGKNCFGPGCREGSNPLYFPEITVSVQEWAGAAIKRVTDLINAGKCDSSTPDPGCRETVSATAKLKVGNYLSYGLDIGAKLAGAKESELKRGTLGEQTQLPKGDGFFRATMPMKTTYASDHPDSNQPEAVNVSFGQSASSQTSTKIFKGNEVDRGYAVDVCSRTPAKSTQMAQAKCAQMDIRQPEQLFSTFAITSHPELFTNASGGIGTQGKSGPGAKRCPGTVPGGFMQSQVIQAASDASIPLCVLEAVGIIEGAYTWGQSDDVPLGQNSCVPSQCSAAGPFQFTTGVDQNGDPQCSQCSDWTRKNGCPKTWQQYVGRYPGVAANATPCNISASAHAAANKLKNDSGIRSTVYSPTMDAGIRQAGTNYYGSSRVETFTGCGKGTPLQLSYGNFIVAHCKTRNGLSL